MTVEQRSIVVVENAHLFLALIADGAYEFSPVCAMTKSTP